MNKHIIVLGMMGSGKTTLGKLLSEHCNLPHIDLDHYIAKVNNQNFQDFFNQHSIENFRLLEMKYLDTLINELDTTSIISLGGGTLTHTNSLAKYLVHQTVYLQCSAETLLQRLKNPSQQNQRPLLQGLSSELLKNKLQQMMKERETLYKQASYTVSNDTDDALKTLNEIVKVLCLP